MVAYSFEKYMGQAICAEHSAQGSRSDEQQLLFEVPGDSSGDFPLDKEAQIVAYALQTAEIDLDKSVVNPLSCDPNDMITAKMGWDVGIFTPNPHYSSVAINGESKNRLLELEGILLDKNSTLYFCGLYFDPDRPGDLGKECARRKYEPGATLEENEERIRYGLARLVAKHELELPG